MTLKASFTGSKSRSSLLTSSFFRVLKLKSGSLMRNLYSRAGRFL